jgi:hypothetical protein
MPAGVATASVQTQLNIYHVVIDIINKNRKMGRKERDALGLTGERHLRVTGRF